MRDQFLNDGIENFDFHVARSIECKKLSQSILFGDYAPDKGQRVLVEKSKGLCRQLVIPSVKDAIVLQCLSDALYMDIKGKAPTDKSYFEPKDHKFSSAPSEYGNFASWLNFQKALFNFSKTRNIIAVTDIANYYDSISYVHLRNALSSIAGVDECILDMLIFVLSDLLWQPDYTPRIEVGLPQINLDAPRLLAHCFLYELDAFLNSDPNRDFVRYMDDIDVGVDTVAQAKCVLKEIDLVLQAKQVRLNSGKTLILTRRDALKHFRVFENARIDIVKNRIEYKKKSNLPFFREKKLVEARLKKGIKQKAFDAGNGEKILKRWLGLAAQVDANIKPDLLEHIIKLRPSVRENVYAFIRSRPLKPSNAEMLAKVSVSGMLIDDAAMVEMSNNLVETMVITRNCHAHIQNIIASNDKNSFFGLYCKLWLQSKYDKTSELIRTLMDSQSIWWPSDRMGRLVASFLPLFHNSPEEVAYRELLGKTLNPGVREAYKFHMNLSSDPKIFGRMFDALKAPNVSRGTGITHAKFLCLLSALRNPNAPPASLAKLKLNNAHAFSDTYYKSIGKRLGVI